MRILFFLYYKLKRFLIVEYYIIKTIIVQMYTYVLCAISQLTKTTNDAIISTRMFYVLMSTSGCNNFQNSRIHNTNINNFTL